MIDGRTVPTVRDRTNEGRQSRLYQRSDISANSHSGNSWANSESAGWQLPSQDVFKFNDAQ